MTDAHKPLRPTCAKLHIAVISVLLVISTSCKSTDNTAAENAINPGPHPTESTAEVRSKPLRTSGNISFGNVPKDDGPEHDGWTTEITSQKVDTQLAILRTALRTKTWSNLDQFVASEVSVSTLTPSPLKAVFSSPSVTVLRPSRLINATMESGVASLKNELQRIISPYSKSPLIGLKVVRIQPNDDGADTQILVEISGPTTSGLLEQHSRWRCRWNKQQKLTQLQLLEYERTQSRSKDTLFSDCTTSVVGRTRGFSKQLHHGADYWNVRTDWTMGYDPIGHKGLAVADVNGDGLDDVYVAQPIMLPNRLYIQQPDGSAKEQSAEAGLDWLELTRSVLFVDLDNDGDQDLVAAMNWGTRKLSRTVLLLENDGTGRFAVKSDVLKGVDVLSISSADYDNDGDLDLYVGRYNARLSGAIPVESPIPFHDANNGGANTLLRNDGNWQFTDVTETTGLSVNNQRFTLSTVWEDFDNDGDQDLYVANDFGRNNLYQNDNGQFKDIAASAGVEDLSAGMSVSWADTDRDGHMDLYIGNMFSAAGGRIAYQRQFNTGVSQPARAGLQRMARGNSLFRNTGDGQFEDLSLPSGTTMGRWSWSSMFTDLNNDGWDDLVVANGLYTRKDPGDL